VRTLEVASQGSSSKAGKFWFAGLKSSLIEGARTARWYELRTRSDSTGCQVPSSLYDWAVPEEE
jgi:hypothetical protein